MSTEDRWQIFVKIKFASIVAVVFYITFVTGLRGAW